MKKFREINRLKEDSMDSSTLEAPAGNQFRQGDSPAARSMIEKPQKEPMKKLKQEEIEIPKDAPSVETVAKKHGVSVDEIKKQLKIGMSVEAEHGKNKGSEREIAMDHLNEKPDYYKKLKKYVEETEQVNEMLKPKMSALDKFRQASSERTKKHDDIEKQMQARHAAGKEDMSGAIDRLEKSLNREEVELDEGQNKQVEGGDPCWKNYQMVGKKMKNGKEVPNCVPVKEETDTLEKSEMAQTQLHFIKYAAEEILEYINMGGKIEEWYQNKLSKVQSEVESLHSYVEGESRRTGMKEEVEELDEAPVVIKTNKPIGARVTSIGPGGKKTVIKSDPPFDGPYTKVKDTITDKSGAKHSPMSRARDLARSAALKQTKKLQAVKEEKEDSRKAEIVKDVMKKAKKKKSETTGTDKFEANPVLSSEIQKQ
jgi:hypothetical protein